MELRQQQEQVVGALCLMVKAYEVCGGTANHTTAPLESCVNDTPNSEEFSGTGHRCLLWFEWLLSFWSRHTVSLGYS